MSKIIVPGQSDFKNKHLMLDLETMGRKPGMAVMSIGATLFDPDADPTMKKPLHMNEKHHFYVVINQFDSSTNGFMADPQTMKWWRSRPIWSHLGTEVMRSEIGVRRGCEMLAAFIAEREPVKVWANSPTFDVEILRALYTKTRVSFPIEYRQEADFRTVMDLTYPKREMRPSRPEHMHGYHPHHALGDAIVQAHHIITAINVLKASKQFNDLNTMEILEFIRMMDKDAQKDLIIGIMRGMDPDMVREIFAEVTAAQVASSRMRLRQ